MNAPKSVSKAVPKDDEKKLHVLIVEDDPDCLAILQRILTPVAECDVAINGVEAIDRVATALEQRQPYHLVCLDLMMPNIDGREALNSIRDLEREHNVIPGRRTKVILTTSVDEPDEVLGEELEHHYQAFLPKPLKRQELLCVLGELGLLSSPA